MTQGLRQNNQRHNTKTLRRHENPHRRNKQWNTAPKKLTQQ
jgi:hypothetical protein